MNTRPLPLILLLLLAVLPVLGQRDLADVAAEVEAELSGLKLADAIRPGQTVAAGQLHVPGHHS